MKFLLAIATLISLASDAGLASQKQVLVILSSSDRITLKEEFIHPTGFFLPELIGPIKKLRDAGYTFVFANPQGTLPVMDKVSDSSFWFGDLPGASPEAKTLAQNDYQQTRQFCEDLGLCGAPGTLVGSLRLTKLSTVIGNGLEGYAAVFFPGGHAPMEDLWKDTNVGQVLRYFHAAQKPTALICHAPISLLAALDKPEQFMAAQIADDRRTMVETSKNWIYQGYAMTGFTTREEQQEESGGQDNALGGFVKFYADASLEKAGGYVIRADKWQSNVVVSHELITGQNPFSHDAIGEKLLQALEKGLSK